uniref:Uncharacterized protein n=1 Tax=Romanomermis culicivorax TaxID=13658 RepID=A0A915KNW6_ROMCU
MQNKNKTPKVAKNAKTKYCQWQFWINWVLKWACWNHAHLMNGKVFVVLQVLLKWWMGDHVNLAYDNLAYDNLAKTIWRMPIGHPVDGCIPILLVNLSDGATGCKKGTMFGNLGPWEEGSLSYSLSPMVCPDSAIGTAGGDCALLFQERKFPGVSPSPQDPVVEQNNILGSSGNSGWKAAVEGEVTLKILGELILVSTGDNSILREKGKLELIDLLVKNANLFIEVTRHIGRTATGLPPLPPPLVRQPPPIFSNSINTQEHYAAWAHTWGCQNDVSFFVEEFNIKQLIRTVPRYVQLAYPDGRALVFKALSATGEDWTAFFKHFDNTHTIVTTFDADNDWCALYTLVGPSFGTASQNAEPMVIPKIPMVDIF